MTDSRKKSILRILRKIVIITAVLIISGIIDLRKDDVLNSALAHGFKIVEENYKDNWCAFTLKK